METRRMPLLAADYSKGLPRKRQLRITVAMSKTLLKKRILNRRLKFTGTNMVKEGPSLQTQEMYH